MELLERLYITKQTLVELGINVSPKLQIAIDKIEHPELFKEKSKKGQRLFVVDVNGNIMRENTNAGTFKAAILSAGVDNVRKLAIVSYGRPLITEFPLAKKNKFSLIGDCGLYLSDKYSSDHMKEILDSINDQLELGWEIILK